MVNRLALIRAAALGATEIARRFAAGTLDPEARAVALKGMERFLGAIASGDIAADSAIAGRRAVCGKCPSRTEETAPGASGPSWWCGPSLRPSVDPPTCGCLLVGKTIVASETCPRWASLTINGDSVP